MSDQFGLDFAVNFFDKFRPHGVNGFEISRNFENFHPTHEIVDKFLPNVVNIPETSRNFEEFRAGVVNMHEYQGNSRISVVRGDYPAKCTKL